MWGATQRATIDAALEEISRLQRDKANALDHVIAYIREHPDADDDTHMLQLRLALL